MRNELEANSEWYLERVTQSNYDNALREAAGKYEYPALLHVAALANYLKRPVFVVDEEQKRRIYGPRHQGTAAVLPPAHCCCAASSCLFGCAVAFLFSPLFPSSLVRLWSVVFCCFPSFHAA